MRDCAQLAELDLAPSSSPPFPWVDPQSYGDLMLRKLLKCLVHAESCFVNGSSYVVRRTVELLHLPPLASISVNLGGGADQTEQESRTHDSENVSSSAAADWHTAQETATNHNAMPRDDLTMEFLVAHKP